MFLDNFFLSYRAKTTLTNRLTHTLSYEYSIVAFCKSVTILILQLGVREEVLPISL